MTLASIASGREAVPDGTSASRANTVPVMGEPFVLRATGTCTV